MPDFVAPLQIVVEGETDAVVVTRLLQGTGIFLDSIKVAGGKSKILEKLRGYNQSARFGGNWLVIMDLDQDADCAPGYLRRILPERSSKLALRIAVRSCESWLIADYERMSAYTGINVRLFPPHPDEETDPKQSLVDLIDKKCRRSRLRRDMLPIPGSGRRVGPNYAVILRDFTLEHWRPEVAAERSDSLARCIRALEALKRQSAQ